MHDQAKALKMKGAGARRQRPSRLVGGARNALVMALALGPWSAFAGANGAGGKSAPRAAKPPLAADQLTPLDVSGLGEQLRKARGRDLFIHLWASWCGPCLEELPEVDRFAREARARGATFLSVSLDDPKRAAHVLDVLHRRAPNLTPYVARFEDPDKFIAFFSTEWEGAIPALFSYDRQGHLRGSVIGEIENADIRRMLADISIAPPDSDSGRSR